MLLRKKNVHGTGKVKLERQDVTNVCEAFNPSANELRLVESQRRLMNT